MSVLVTGGAGYIGSHTAVELLNAGEEIIILDNFSNSKPSVLDKIREITAKNFKFYEADILDKPALEKVFSENNIDTVIHFAGLKAVGESVQKPLMYYRNNITGTLILCDVMQNHGCKNIVFSSSATVYGDPETVPVTEDSPLHAMSPYGNTKLMLEQILSDLTVSDSEWSVSLLRYFNPIGAHESGLIGEEPSGIPNNLMPYICRVAAGILPCLNVFGDDYPTPDGTGVRDYIHVVDLAKGHLKALNYTRQHKGAFVCNLGTGKGCSVLEVIHAFEKANNIKVNYRIAPRRPGDVPEYYANADKAKRELGWTAELDIEDMCRSAWNYILHNK